MNKNIFFDIQLGASGDMLVGALLDTGDYYNKMMSMLSKLKLPNWEILPEKVTRHSLAGTKANIKCKDDKHHRNLNDIQIIINESELSENIKKNIIKIFSRLAQAEAGVHGKKIDEIHFHEIGAIDSIIDISAFCILIDILEINKIYYNEFPFGKGTIQSAHGEIPVPVPAVVELIKGTKSKSTDKPGELITPTAAAILISLGEQKSPESFVILQRGTGFGTREHPFASYTRVFLIENAEGKEEIQQLECNIDDMNPQIYPDIIDMLLEAGALDAYISAISMKKGRPGILLTVIADIDNISNMKKIIYSNTTTLGVRIFNISREKLFRKFETVIISGQEIKMKIGYFDHDIVNVQPEYIDCKQAARNLNIPIKQIMAEAIHEYKLKNKTKGS